ncbi:MAG TPA: hypothetical protein VJ965_03660 [Anaerolineales bacterium]|nr:hypothetical protein [Anaerolineales bacterium]
MIGNLNTMKRLRIIWVIFALFLLGACDAESILPTTTPVPTSDAAAANADVIFVQAVEEEEGTWTFTVTIEHPDTGWEDYADGWDVVLSNGEVLKPDGDSPFTRLLTHPHENEQPFTRSQSGIVIPTGVNEVVVRAHDLVDGFGGQTVVVQLNQSSGLNFEVERDSSSELLPQIGVTNQRQDGNRLVYSQMDLQNTTPLDIPISGKPVWVVGVPYEEGSTLWVVALEDGRLLGYKVLAGEYELVDLPVSQLDPAQPPAVAYDGDKIDILNINVGKLAPFTHPVLLDSDSVAYVTDDGRLRIQGSSVYEELTIDALLDGRVLTDGSGRILLLVQPTGIYDHAVLGDDREAKAFSLVTSSGEVMERVAFYNDQVIEGLAPLWADLNGDGQREVIVTASNRQSGAQLVVYSEAGQQLAQGEAIGAGYRWRHQIAVAPFGPNQEIELVDVLTPHIGGVVEFFQLRDNKLVKVAEVSGYTSHVINTRNLDMALAADVDKDGQIELVLPTQNLDALGVIQRTDSGAEVAFEVPLNGSLSSNLAAITLPGGRMALAAGLEAGVLRVWIP